MLREAALYSRVSGDHQREAALFLAKYGPLLTSQPGEAVLDLGCGPGDVTAKVILPSLHPHFSTLVGLDVCPEMVEFARDKWSCEERLQFVEADAAEPDPARLAARLPTTAFHKIFSFNALHWVQDRRQLARNISSLLKPGGEALLVVVTDSYLYHIWDSLIDISRWRKYFKGMKTPLNEYIHMIKPEEELAGVLIQAGLQVLVKEKQFHSNAFSSQTHTDQLKIDRLRSVDPLVSLVPKDEQKEYLSDLLELVTGIDERGAVDYHSLTVLARKPEILPLSNAC